MMMGYYGYGGGPFGGSLGWLGLGLGVIVHLAFAAIVVLAAIWLLRVVMHGGRYHAGTAAREPDALEIARRRYARGEISAEEFQRLKKDLA